MDTIERICNEVKRNFETKRLKEEAIKRTAITKDTKPGKSILNWRDFVPSSITNMWWIIIVTISLMVGIVLVGGVLSNVFAQFYETVGELL